MTQSRTALAQGPKKHARWGAAVAALAVAATSLLFDAPAAHASELPIASDGDISAAALTDVGTWFNDRLFPNHYIQSSNDRYRLAMQSDGNLVLYDLVAGRACWGSGTQNIAGVWAEYNEGWADPTLPHLDLNSPYGRLRRYLGGYTWLHKSGNASINNSGEVWIAYKKFVSC
jgi:hypothetical protein